MASQHRTTPGQSKSYRTYPIICGPKGLTVVPSFPPEPRCIKKGLLHGVKKEYQDIRRIAEYDQVVDASTARLAEDATVSLSNGQVINVRRLAIHLGRRQEYLRTARKRSEQQQFWVDHPNAIRTLKTPDAFRVSEAALYYTKAYIQGRYQGAVTAEEFEDSRMGLGKSPGLEWNYFAGTVG